MLVCYALLRPFEYICLTVGHIMLPSITGLPHLFVKILPPFKMMYRGARQQHTKIEGPSVISFIEKTLRSLPHWKRIYYVSVASFRLRIQKLIEYLEVTIVR